MRAVTYHAVAATLAVAAGCGDSTRPAASSGPDYMLGQIPAPATACESDLDCPPNYVCVAQRCTVMDIDADNDGFSLDVDCADGDPARNPGAAEACNGIDDNCNGDIDEGVLNACGECGPLPPEVCDLADNDCNGLVDDSCVTGVLPEQEPNDGSLSCQWIPLPPAEGEVITLSGAFSPAGDLDSYCFEVLAGTALIFDVDSLVLGAPTDAVIALFDNATGTQLPGGYNDYQPAVGPDPYLEYTFAADGAVRANIYNFENAGGPSYIYELRITATYLVTCEDIDGDGVSTCDGDCSDGDPMIFPNQTETCDGADNNCDGTVDEDCPQLIRAEREPNGNTGQCELLTVPFSRAGVINPSGDLDVFCFFAPGNTTLGFDIDAKEPPYGSALDSRIVLTDAGGANLPGTYQNDDGRDPDTGYQATDSDSYLTYVFALPGIYAVRVSDVFSFRGGSTYTYILHTRVLSMPTCADDDGDGVSTCEGDCRDNDPEVHFGAPEICDGKDNDCNNVGDPAECTGDFDGDGFSEAAGDCDDSDPTRFPGATETCNELDDDCDGIVDDGVQNACGTCGFPPAERCGDGNDNDCDGSIDTDCDVDADSDTFTPDAGDCHDGDPAISPAATEICDSLDNDCDGLIDEFVKNACGYCGPAPDELCDGLDNNCNGIIDDGVLNACGECGPAPLEVCDGADNNCDGQVDEGLLNACGECGPTPTEVCDWLDNDCNGLADEGCDVHGDADGQTRRQGDCNDDDPSIYWGAPEACNGVDDNCNGMIDDDPSCPRPEVEPNNTAASCTPVYWPGLSVTGTVTSASDVDYVCLSIEVAGTALGFDIDARDLGSPLDSQIELYDAAGNRLFTNNNGTDPETGIFTADSYAEHTFESAGNYTLLIKAAGTGSSAGAGAFYQLFTRVVGGCLDLDGDGIDLCNGDCNDLNSSTHPGAVDICDSADNNCDGTPDERCVGSCLDDAYEDNDTFATATPVVANAPSYNATYCGGDRDLYGIDLTAGQALQVDLLFVHAEVDLSLEMIAPDGFTVLAQSRTSDDNEQVMVTAAESGRHFVHVYGALAAEGSYALLLRSPPP